MVQIHMFNFYFYNKSKNVNKKVIQFYFEFIFCITFFIFYTKTLNYCLKYNLVNFKNTLNHFQSSDLSSVVKSGDDHNFLK